MKIFCKNCNKKVNSYPSDKKKYCSRKCYWKNGRKQDKKVREKISKTMISKGLNPQIWGEWYTPCGMKGKKHSITTRIKMSKAHQQRLGDKYHSGHKYRIERRKEMGRLRYKLWREKVFERDNYTCNFCEVRGGRLEADHIVPWNLNVERRYKIGNGRTLCKECHRKTDTWGSKSKEVTV
jgi:hypothetical protein